jgi:serine O-acetyltransferase
VSRFVGLCHEDLKAKARRYYQSDGPRDVAKALVADGSPAMLLYRLQQASRAAGLKLPEALFYKLNALGGCVIGRGAEFGPGFVLIHSNGVVINGRVKAGANVQVQHQVTIGNNERGEAPVLGSDIVVGAGAKIIGPVRLGDGSRVGANAVVVHDVEPHTTVVGIPAKAVRRREAPETNGPSAAGEDPSH